MVSQKAFMAGTGCTLANALIWLEPMNTAMAKSGINTPKRQAAFLGNVGVECAGLSDMDENMNYSAARLAIVWPNKFAVDPKAVIKTPNVLAKHIAGNPIAIANEVYAGKFGNGDQLSGDGWNYRGQGPLMLTFKYNFDLYARLTGTDILKNPASVQEPVNGSLVAAAFFAKVGCNAAADSGDFASTVKLINGAYPNDANQGSLRLQRINQCLTAWNPEQP